MRGNRIDDVAEGQHRVRDGNRDARQADDPYDQADPVERNATNEMRFDRHAAQLASPVVARERNHAEDVGPGLEQQLRRGIQRDAGEQEGECGPGHVDKYK